MVDVQNSRHSDRKKKFHTPNSDLSKSSFTSSSSLDSLALSFLVVVIDRTLSFGDSFACLSIVSGFRFV
jgi:hypothetical protein